MLESPLEPYAAIGALVLIVASVAVVMLILAHTVGPKRRGPVKDTPYESGMPVLADTQRRFNVRFYIVAMLFLLFDVDIVFLWPWAQVFHDAATNGTTIAIEGAGSVGVDFLLGSMGLFFGLLVFGLLYEWKKGAFRWD